MNSGKVFLGVVAGLAAGAALGMLFAPEKDSKARKVISKKTDDLIDAVNEKIEDKFRKVMDVVTERLKKAKHDDSTTYEKESQRRV
jgi:gas vesicle protein